MVERPSAAASIYPHLKRAQVSTPKEPRRNVPTSDLARALYPHLTKKEPTPSEVRAQWHDHMVALAGLRRKR